MQNNKDIINQIKSISNIFQSGNFIDAISKSKKLLHKIPNNEFLLNIVGMSYLNLGKIDEAKNLYLKVIKQNPRIVSFKNNYANVLKSLDNINEAEKILVDLVESNPNYINAINNLANLKKNLKKFDEAIELLHRALRIDPKNITILYNLALCYRSTRNYDQVYKFAQKINDIDPSFTMADKIMSEIQNYNEKNGDKHLSIMNKKLKEISLSNEQKIPLYFSLGKAYEDIEQYELSFKNYLAGNKLRRKSFNYNFNDEKKKLNSIKKIFENKKIVNCESNSVNKKIIFICGMPRSGTTLLEQIVSSHTKVEPLGETEFLGKTILKYDLESFKLQEFDKNIIYKDYSNYIEKFNSKSQIFTDKSLLNFQLIGFIKIFFPTSKVLVLKRDFDNNFLSIFKNELLGPQLRWTFDAKEIKEYYSLFLDYINFWNDTFPNFLLEVNYEKLVSNTEKIVKDVINYCELDWQDNCLNYHRKNKSAIDTASANQANKPIYETSLNKFEVYKKFFKSL